MGKRAVCDFTTMKQAIDQCPYIFADSIHEIDELTFQVVLREAKAQATILASESKDPVELLKVGSSPIKSDPSCRRFRVVFEPQHVISFAVLNESYARYPQPPEKFEGKLFRVFSRSHLLEFTKQTTYASDEHPGTLLHFQIACLNHVIDVITTATPMVSLIETSSQMLAAMGGTQPDLEYIPRRRPPYT